MTLEDVKKLTDDELRVKVAEFCGWENIVVNEHGPYGDNTTLRLLDRHIPDYCHDLNAMYEAEKLVSAWDDKGNIIGDEKWMRYYINLCQIVWRDSVSRTGSAVCATAAQRAEAFVLTMSR
jgi:hypothetical protein